jgi:hypothetical protein
MRGTGARPRAYFDRLGLHKTPDQKTLCVAVNWPSAKGYLLALDTATLQVKSKTLPRDPQTGAPARVTGDSTASPTVGPDGDVFFGCWRPCRTSTMRAAGCCISSRNPHRDRRGRYGVRDQ